MKNYTPSHVNYLAGNSKLLNKYKGIIVGIAVIVAIAIACVIANAKSPDNNVSQEAPSQNPESSIDNPTTITKKPDDTNKKNDENESINVTQVYFLVTNVVDGDTIDINDNGTTRRIRLIGVNTPETVHPNKAQECFGKEASNYTKSRLLNKRVVLEEDKSQDNYDAYGRLLRYVWLDGNNFNKQLIYDGYAYEYTYNVPYKYQSEFEQAQKDASKNSRGLWAPDTCSGTSSGNTQTTTTPTTTTTPVNTTAKCVIKGNISSNGEKIYHMPGQRYYDKTIINESYGERWFCTEEEAVAAGWRKSLR